MSSTNPGWHRDPAEPDTQRYWDGEQWLGERLPLGAPAPEGPLQLSATPSSPPTTLGAPMPVPTAIGPTGPTATGPTGSPAHALVGQSQLAVLATLAPIEQRLLARLIDFGVLLALNIVINGYFFILFLREIQPALTQAENGDNPFQITYSGRATTLALVIQLVAMALWFAYEVLATANTGQTFGKKVAGVRVVTADGRPLGFRRSILRWLPVGVPVTIGLLAVPILLIDALWCTWDKPRRQCLHDKAAATLVVRAATNSHSGEPPCR